jgi:hypothetical protein
MFTARLDVVLAGHCRVADLAAAWLSTTDAAGGGGPSDVMFGTVVVLWGL